METLTAFVLIITMLQGSLVINTNSEYKQIEAAFRYAKIELNNNIKINDISIVRNVEADNAKIYLSLTVEREYFYNSDDFPKQEIGFEPERQQIYMDLVAAVEKCGWDIKSDNIVRFIKFTQRSKTLYHKKSNEDVKIDFPYTVNFLTRDNKESATIDVIVTYYYPFLTWLTEEYIVDWF